MLANASALFRAPIVIFVLEISGSKENVSSFMNTNNPLAVEPETENETHEQLRRSIGQFFWSFTSRYVLISLDQSESWRGDVRGFPKMIKTLRHGALLVTAIIMAATPDHPQTPIDAQRNAIRSQLPRRLSGLLRQRPDGP